MSFSFSPDQIFLRFDAAGDDLSAQHAALRSSITAPGRRGGRRRQDAWLTERRQRTAAPDRQQTDGGARGSAHQPPGSPRQEREASPLSIWTEEGRRRSGRNRSSQTACQRADGRQEEGGGGAGRPSPRRRLVFIKSVSSEMWIRLRRRRGEGAGTGRTRAEADASAGTEGGNR